MREIKFRGRQLLEHSGMNDTAGKWLYGYVVIESTQTLMYWQEGGRIRCERVAPETVGQYTGLKSKSGQEIYEGDKLSILMDIRTVVEFDEGAFVCNRGTGVKPNLGDILEVAVNIEVIGNIYENPEILHSAKEINR